MSTSSKGGKMKKKYKSYSFWTALSGAVVIFLNALGECFGFSINNDLVSGVIMAFAGVLVVLGIVTMDKSEGDQTESDSQPEDTIEDEEEQNTEGQDDENKTE